MAAFNNTKNPFENLHSDVLRVEPSSEEEKVKLVAEIKERGNNAFKTRRMEEADILYSRAIEYCTTLYLRLFFHAKTEIPFKAHAFVLLLFCVCLSHLF